MTRLKLPFSICAAASAVLVTALALPASAAARRPVDERRPADPQGQVEIIDVSGRIAVQGWDKAEIGVTGTIGDSVEKLDISSSGTRTTIRVVSHEHAVLHFDWGGKTGDADLVVHVPRGSSLMATLVSADLSSTDVQGNQELHSESGDFRIAANRDLRIGTVSGDVHVTAGADSKHLEINTTSGDVHVSGGGGEVAVKTVSGDGVLSLGTVSRFNLKTVSGDFKIDAALTADGRFEAESVSGDFMIGFTGPVPPAEFDVQSVSGDLTTCFGRSSVKEKYGAGSRLNYKEGAGTAGVKVDTMSGDVGICAKR
jgi:DUF4097 and DUF4098 domain-containing protein YvlB